MSDYSMLGSFSDGGASALNGDLITKLKEAESKAVIDPIDKKIENNTAEGEKFTEIEATINDFYQAIKPLDLFYSGTNAFDAISANTTGDSVIFDAADTSKLQNGTTNVTVNQLAQKDVWQSDISTTPEDDLNQGDFVFQIAGGDDITIDTTDISLNELADKINGNDGVHASVEKIGVDDDGNDQFRLIIKADEPGEANKITFGNDTTDAILGFDNSDNNTLVAQDLDMDVDGVNYKSSSSSITIDNNLTIIATKLGDSTLTVEDDNTQVVESMHAIADAYNAMVAKIDEELYAEDSVITDKSALRSMVSDIKNMFYKTYGDDETSIFSYGVSFDTEGNGLMIIDDTALNEGLVDNPDALKSLFVGVAEDKGIATQIKEYIDDQNFYDGMLARYEDKIEDRKTQYEEEKEKAQKLLDQKYDTMAAQFAAYGAIISQMEASFSGLKMEIDQSVSSK